MRNLFKTLPLCVLLSFFAACATTQPHSEFVKTVNFSSLNTFSYKHTMVTGMEFRDSEKRLLESLSEATISSGLQALGFEAAVEPAEADFFAVVKWKKAVSASVNPFQHIDPYQELMDRREQATQFASRIHLTLEIYETESGNLFWRKDLPNSFDALQLTEERVTQSLMRAMANFPEHIKKDPNLPSIE